MPKLIGCGTRRSVIADLNQQRLWIESKPEVPEGEWYKDFGSFKIWGHVSYPKTFLLRGQAARGRLATSILFNFGNLSLLTGA